MGKNAQNQIFIAIESEKSVGEEKWWGFIFREFLTTLMKAFDWLVLLSDFVTQHCWRLLEVRSEDELICKLHVAHSLAEVTGKRILHYCAVGNTAFNSEIKWMCSSWEAFPWCLWW